MNHPLDGVRQKIIRAEEHLATITTEIGVCLEKCRVLREPDPDANSNRYILTFSFPAPDLGLSIIIGECLHNLRSALDHIVWQLVLLNKHTPNQDNQFPICETPDGFRRHLSRNRLRGVSISAETLVEGLQPYNARLQRPDLHPLWVLNQLMNIDKHRTLTLATIRAREVIVRDSPSGRLLRQVSNPEVLRDGTQFIIDLPPEREEVSMDYKRGLLVAFEDAPVRDMEISSVMRGLVEFIKDRVIPRFEPLF